MDVYDLKGNLLAEYDLSLGRLAEGYRKEHVEEQEAVEEIWHYETVKEYPNGGKDVRRVVDVPGKSYIPAHDKQVECVVYIPYTEEELQELAKPSPAQRLAALEEENANLKEALELLLSGEVE